jgi:hypothetical protein
LTSIWPSRIVLAPAKSGCPALAWVCTQGSPSLSQQGKSSSRVRKG